MKTSNMRRGRSLLRSASLALSALLLSVGCATLIGLDEYEVGEADETGGRAGTGGTTSGSSGAAGRGGSGGTAGSGQSGSGGTGGVFGCSVDERFVPNEDVVRACALKVGCDPFEPSTTISFCVTLNLLSAFEGEACNLTATSCEDIDKCLGRGFASSADCPPGTVGWACDTASNRAVFCEDPAVDSDGSSFYRDCTRLGGSCVDVMAPGNVFAGCQVLPTCTGEDGLNHCDGDTLYTCVGGAGYGTKCDLFSAKCEEDILGEGGCFYPLPLCTGLEPACAGNVAQYCTDDLELFNYDCGAVGLTCIEDTVNGGGLCAAPSCTDSDVYNCVESCDGTVLNYCYGGSKQALNCVDLGFSGCQELQTSTGTDFATCVP